MRRSLRLLSAVASSATIVAACSHQIESPVVSAQGLEPDLACNDKPATRDFSTVSINGANMTPMPSKTLEDKRELILPSVTLEMVTPISVAGVTPPTGPIKLTDDPANPATSRLKWTSESSMSFDVHPADKLPTGVMTVVVTNPDGQSVARIEKGLAIVPKPTIAELRPPAICDDQSDQTVVIQGTNFLVFDDKTPTVTVGDKTYSATFDAKDCTPVEGNFREKDIKLCSAVTIKIPMGDFKITVKTKVPVTVTNPAPADCVTSDFIELTLNPPPKVTGAQPASVCEGGSTVTVTGEGFETGAKVQLRCPTVSVDASNVRVEPDGKTLSATFGAGAPAGEMCEVIVTNPDGCEDRPLPHQKVTITTGPIVFFVDPPTVFNGINTRITIFATTIRAPLADDAVMLVPSAGGTGTKLAYTTVTGYPNRLQATIPKDTAPGEYDVILKDATGCGGILPKAVTVTGTTTVTLRNVVPPFGWTNDDTSVTVFRNTTAAAPANAPFVATPRVFLNPVGATATDVAVPMVGVSFLDGDRVTGTVPKGTPVKKYDVVLVNKDGSVGFLPGAYDELATAPPVITTATPSSVVATTGQVVTLTGRNFVVGATADLQCVNSAGAAVTAPKPTMGTCTATACPITMDASAVGAGGVCVVRLTNPDGAFGEYSAIGVTGPSLNLNTPVAGPEMNVARRALSAASGDATSAQRFVYALGGDGGTAATALDSYEFAPVDLFGKVGSWTVSPVTLSAKRTLGGAVTVGRYIYYVGGDDGAGPVNSADRALILSPRETPEITDIDAELGMNGLDAGEYQYRVSTVFTAADTDNPGGESLPSDPFTLRLPTITNKKIAVTVVFRAATDSLGAVLPNVAKYRIYRTPKDGAPGSEVLLGETTDGTTLTFKDDGTKTLGTQKPIPLGSTGNWLKLPAMAAKRSALGVAHAFEPGSAAKFYVYAIMGKDTPTNAVGSYEYLTVDIAANGRQTFGATWTAGAVANAVPRSEFGSWVMTSAQSSLVTGTDTWIYVGGGRANGGLNGAVDAAKVAAGGALGAWAVLPKDFSSDSAGYGVCGANNQLFVFGGAGGAPSAGAKAATLETPIPTLTSNSWNNEGLSMTQSRYLLGSAVQSAFIFLLGGQTGTATASKSTESVIW